MLWQMLSDAFRGPAAARQAHARELAREPSIQKGVVALQQASPVGFADDDDAPIFLLSAGWRSGSTMLQRLIMSDRGVFIWGEPYDECGMLQAMADSHQAFRAGWPPADYFHDGKPPGDLAGEWIANLFPSIAAWREGQRAFFDTAFARPAQQAGARRWGIKEVRLTAAHCHWLKWLYPKARFVLLYRNPLEAYRSYARYGRSWYDVYPQRPVHTPAAFGRHWRLLMEGYLREAPALGAMLVRYEDLVKGKLDLGELERYLGISVDRGVMEQKVGSSEREGRRVTVNALERWLLRREVSDVASRLGYEL